MPALATQMGAIIATSTRIFNITPNFSLYEIVPSEALIELFSESSSDDVYKKLKFSVHGIDVGPLLYDPLPLIPPEFPIEKEESMVFKLHPHDSDRQYTASLLDYPLKFMAFPWNGDYYLTIISEIPGKDVLRTLFSIARSRILKNSIKVITQSIEVSELRPATDDEVFYIKSTILNYIEKNSMPIIDIFWDRIFYEPRTGAFSKPIDVSITKLEEYLNLARSSEDLF